MSRTVFQRVKDFVSGASPQNNIAKGLSVAAGNFINSFTAKFDHLRYGFGSKGLKGSVDCSGWVNHVVTGMIAKICGAGSAIGSGIKRIMNCSAAEQLRGLIKAGCGIASSLIKSGQVAVGTVIGVCRSKIPAWAKGRWGGISHVGVVTEVNGKKYISESSGGGVKLTEYNTWVQKNDSGKLYAANPLLLVKDNGPNYSGYDGRKNNIAQVRTPYLAPAAKSHYASTHTHVTASLDNASPRSRSGSPFRYS